MNRRIHSNGATAMSIVQNISHVLSRDSPQEAINSGQCCNVDIAICEQRCQGRKGCISCVKGKREEEAHKWITEILADSCQNYMVRIQLIFLLLSAVS